MSKKKVKVLVNYVYELEIESDDSVVKDYDTQYELVENLVDYKFSPVLPVLKSGGVTILDIEVQDFNIL